MPDQDSTRITPAPYKGAKGRLQVLNQQLAGATTASGGGGTGLQAGLRPLMAGFEGAIAGGQMKAEAASEVAHLSRIQGADQRALETKVRHAQWAIEDKPQTIDIIRNTVSGLMVAEAVSGRVADATQETVQVPVLDSAGNPLYNEFDEPITVSKQVDSGVGKGFRKLQNLMGTIIPSVGRQRAAQREDDEARFDQAKTQARMEVEMQEQGRRQVFNAYVTQNEIAKMKTLISQGFNDAVADVTKMTKDIEAIDNIDSSLQEFYTHMSGSGRVPALKFMGKSPWDPRGNPLTMRSQVERVQAGTTAMDSLIEEIAKGESSGSFNASNAGTGIVNGKPTIFHSTTDSTKTVGKPITRMTVGEIREASKKPKGDPGRLAFVGRLQWGVKTGAFEQAVKLAGLKEDDVLDETAQKKMEYAYISNSRAYKRYIDNPSPTNRKLLHRWLASQWRAIGANESDETYQDSAAKFNRAQKGSFGAIQRLIDQLAPRPNRE